MGSASRTARRDHVAFDVAGQLDRLRHDDARRLAREERVEPAGIGVGPDRERASGAELTEEGPFDEHFGARRPVVGTITMDMIHVWCGDDEPRVGDRVVLIGDGGHDRIRIEDWAAALDTITYELTCHLTARVPRLYDDLAQGRT